MLTAPITIDVTSPDLLPEEQHIIEQLSNRLIRTRTWFRRLDEYFTAEQRIEHLGIAIPQQLQAVKTAVGWPRLVVEVLDERLDIEGFRFPDQDDADEQLWDIWLANNMDVESQLAHMDAFVFGRAFAMAGSGPGGDSPPLLTVESPLNMVADFDARSRLVTQGLQDYEIDGRQAAALYLPDSTIHLVQEHQEATFTVYDRDDHNLGITPVVMLANRARTHDRYGASEITPEVMAITDAALRTLLGMEFAREFFGAPQRYILGASEDQFVNPNGTPTDAWSTYIGRLLALERDEEGELPQVGTFAASDPTAYTNILTAYSKIMSSHTGLPPHFFGFTTDNPASAEAILASEARLDRRAKRKMRGFGNWRDLMKLALLIQNNGELPDKSHRIEVMWGDPSTPTPQATTMAMKDQVSMGFMPPTSDVLGARLGYSAAERARIAAERQDDLGASVLAELANSLQAKEARVDTTIARDIGTPAPPTPPPNAKPDNSNNSGSGK